MTLSPHLKTHLSKISKTNKSHGFLLVNKPEGISSFGIVRKVRAVTGVKKVGHAGTLDPFASGLLILALGKSYTTQIDTIHEHVKSYRALMVLGVQTDTLDSTGKVTQTQSVPPLSSPLSSACLESIANKFMGEISQMPPIFSAKKVNGRRSYQLARAGLPVTLSPKIVTISHLTLTVIHASERPIIELTVTCSTGTYIRALVRDIAQEFGTVGYTKSLVRTCIGPYSLEEALSIDQLTDPLIQEALIQDE